MATRIRKLPRRWVIAGAVVAGLVAMVALGLLVVYPRVGAWMIRDKVGARLAEKLGREITFGSIDVSLGHATLRDVEVRGPRDGDQPLVRIARVEVDFDAWRSLVGSVRVGDATLDGVAITVRRDGAGRDNVRDLVDRMRGVGRDNADSGGRATRGYLPASMIVRGVRVLADDAITGTTVQVGDGDATWRPGELVARGRAITATTPGAPKAGAAAVEVTKRTGATPVFTVEGGELELYPRLALSGIGGRVVADAARRGDYVIDLAGGYGGVPGDLWTAKGSFDTRALAAAIDLEAAKFQLDRLAPLLERTPVVDYAGTSVDTKLRLEVDPSGARFAGQLHLRGLNVGHPMIADKDVHDLDLSAKITGTFDRATRRLALDQGDFVARDIPFSVTGAVARPGADFDPEAAPAKDVDTGKPLPRLGPGGVQELRLRLVIPPIDCQRVLNAIPTEMAPYLAGYKLRGAFHTDVALEIDWRDLEATKLGGSVGLKKCRVVDQPGDSPKRLKDEFEHYVEAEKGEWLSFVVGPTNDDFVPLEDISPYLIKSIMTTEDAGFYHHKGFITSEFRTALVKNLKAGRFRYGASSITMQLVKNVLLYREKTLARKLQELFLTWHVENTLTKDRILEIYFNVIEYGPSLYGIGPAARHYFGKPAKDLGPVEAAFFSSILPAPKDRYRQYCNDTLTKWTAAKIQRILALMRKRDRITQAEYEQALATPLAFVKDGQETEEECLKRTKKAIKNARSTSPTSGQPPPRPPEPPKPKSGRSGKPRGAGTRGTRRRTARSRWRSGTGAGVATTRRGPIPPWSRARWSYAPRSGRPRLGGHEGNLSAM